jgi:methionyl-tRNA formyltransferase
MKLLLMADHHVGLEITRWLINQYRADVVLVVAMSENEIYKTARESGIACVTFRSAEEITVYFQDMGVVPDLGYLAWWPRLVKTPLLELPTFGFINTHPSLLPYNRGKHYNFWALVEQVPFGVSLHFANEGVDTGDIVAQRSIPYDWEDSGASLYHKAAEAIIDLIKDSYPEIRQLNIQRRMQETDKGTFHLAKELDPASHIYLDRQYRARDLLNLLRARTFPGHPACWFEDDGKEFEVRVEIKRKNS